MLNEKLLANNVLRRIMADAQFTAVQTGSAANSAVRADNPEAGERLRSEANEYSTLARTAAAELTRRNESLV